MTPRVPAGWYPDPDRSDQQRYFDDTGWSPWVSSGQGMTLSPLADPHSLPPSGIDVTREVLRQAQSDGVIDSRTLGALLRYTQRWAASESTSPAPIRSVPAADRPWEPSSALSDSRSSSIAATDTALGRAPQAEFPTHLRPRSPVVRWWQETRETVKSDLAVHGLAYLGVLLLFAGVFGLVVWSFSDINAAMRPVAELAIPGALFAGAAMLNRRGTRVVAAALEVAGGLLLPIVAVASFVDDAPVPPDPTGVGLTVTLGVTTFAIAIGYAIWVRIHPTSALAYLVAPVAWLALGLLSLSWIDPVPQGEAVAQPRATEVAVMAVAAGLTLLGARLRPQLPLAGPTLSGGPVAIAVLALLALLAGSTDGWPTTAAVVTAAGLVTGLEALADRLPGPTLTIATSVTVGLGLLAARSGLETSPWVTAFGFAAATGWAEYHRRGTTGAEQRSYAIAVAALPAGVAAGIVSAMGWPNGLMVVATLLGACGIWLRARRQDVRFWSLWLAATSGVVALVLAVVSTVQVVWPGAADSAALDGAWQAPLVAVLLAAVLGSGRTPHVALNTWAVVAVLAEAWYLAIPALDLSDDLLAPGWAFAAAVAVIALESVPLTWREGKSDGVLGHLTLASLTLGVTAWFVAAADEPRSSAQLAIVTGAGAIAWLYVSVVDERRGSKAVTVARKSLVGLPEGAIQFAPASVAALASAGAITFTIDAAGWITDTVWWSVVPGAIAVVYVAFARLSVNSLPRSSRVGTEAAMLLAPAALVLGIIDLDAVLHFAPAATTFALVIAVAIVVPDQLRDSRPAWLGWGASAAMTVVVADWIGVSRDGWSETLMVWGSAVVLTALAIERLPAAAALRSVVRRTLPPVVLGSFGLGLGACIVAVTEDFSTTGWWFLLVTGTAVGAGVLAREGRLFGVAALASSVSYAALAPWDPVEHPWTIVALGGVWLIASDFSRRWPGTSQIPRLPSSLFWAGQLVVIAALPLVAIQDQRPIGLALAGLVSIAIAIRVPVPTARPWYGAIGAMLILIGAADESLGWLTLAWTALSIGSTTAAAIGRGVSSRWLVVLRLLGATAAAAAWATFTVWAEWSAETTVIATAVGAGLLMASLGVTVQLAPAGRAWVEAWGGVAFLTLLISAWGLALPDVPRAPAGQAVAAGLALAAVAAALGAEPLQRHWLRIATGLLASAAAVAFLYGINAGPSEIVVVAVAMAVTATIGIAAVSATGRGTAWRTALLVVAGLCAWAALTAAITELPDKTLLVGALVAIAAQSVVIGRVLQKTVLLMAGPPLLSLSWMLYASEALGGNPQWYLVPLGLALIVMAGLLRWTRRQAGKDVATIDVVALELAGVGFIAGAALVQTATDSLGYALLAIAEGVTVALWGAVTKVRRRLAAGVGVVIVAVVMLITVPLLPLMPEWRGATLWVAVAGLGLVAIIIATFIERGRAKVGAWVRSLSETLDDWE